jgi:2-polyprenyl-3-methyl-5-hydroxy-6-metoxy-1,4-benzoquinol methylase
MNYESEILRDWYLLFHYGSPAEILDGVGFDPSGLPPRCLDFPVQTVESARLTMEIGRALDLGCAVGRSALELSKISREVIGIDFSETFIEAAEAIRRGQNLAYHRYAEMHQREPLAARLPGGCRTERVSYETGDAMDLRAGIGAFDLVHAANLLCRLPEPKRFLERLPALVKPGGHLVLATPATWMDTYTPRALQPSGDTLAYLRAELDGTFALVRVEEIPFLIREHRRKLQLSTSQTSVWVRR